MSCDLEPTRIRFAVSYPQRLKGLLGKHSGCYGEEVVMFAPCRSIHTFGMRESLDIAFVDEQGTVLRSLRNVLPCKLLSCRKAAVVLERFACPDRSWFSAGDSLVLLGNR